MLWKSLSKQGMINCLYSITGDNAANNVTMITVLQQKFSGIGIRWPKEAQSHRCACHLINIVAKEFLAHMGELTDEDYPFFDNYLGIRLVPIEDSDNEGWGSNSDHQFKSISSSNYYHADITILFDIKKLSVRSIDIQKRNQSSSRIFH
ncbi:hypothetical protein O181_022014 [Austropuccinia psidii MF-1]|uniref:DUF659 domain-containing protein n=1 Tax=Austropuccinia psidii MF-1 TaxID=1389203 RepID=A0A9Q3CE05_9BASI|nr:hypothetical protein [Austropuccinia psidii MF-1]